MQIETTSQSALLEPVRYGLLCVLLCRRHGTLDTPVPPSTRAYLILNVSSKQEAGLQTAAAASARSSETKSMRRV